MAPKPDVEMPLDDPYALIGAHWPSESESAYHVAEVVADDASTAARTQAESADDAKRQTDEGMQGRTANSVSEGYSSIAGQLRQESADFTAISGWMLDAAGKIRAAKKHIANLVSTGTSEIKDAITSETAGTAVTPSSTDLTAKYRDDIAGVASKLTTDLDDIGHSLAGAPGASTTPSYTSVPMTPSAQQPDPHAVVTAYNTGQHPVVEAQRLPEMPRAMSTSTVELPSTPSAPGSTSAPAAPVNPTLAGLISGSGPASTPISPSASSPHGSASSPLNTPAGQGPRGAEQRQAPEHHTPGLPNTPSIPLPDLPAVASDIATAVTSSVGHQLHATSTTPATPLAPASTGITPGTSGPAPMPPAGLAPIGRLPTPPPVTQAAPVAQGTPPTPAPGVQASSAPQQSPPAAPRGPVADLAWIQKSYGLSPSLDLPKSEPLSAPALFIAELPDNEAHLHRVLASIRHQFEQSGWSQPLAVATIRRGLEARTVYATADAISIHPNGILLPSEALPLDEMPGTPVDSHLEGSIMVTEKLTALIPRGWEVEAVLSTVPSDEHHQTAEQFQSLVGAGELLPCTVSRGRGDVTAEVAMSVFARAALGSAGCDDLDSESVRLRAARWVGTQPSGYLDLLGRWYLADAAESMSLGAWGEAVYCSERYLSITDAKRQVA